MEPRARCLSEGEQSLQMVMTTLIKSVPGTAYEQAELSRPLSATSHYHKSAILHDAIEKARVLVTRPFVSLLICPLILLSTITVFNTTCCTKSQTKPPSQRSSGSLLQVLSISESCYCLQLPMVFYTSLGMVLSTCSLPTLTARSACFLMLCITRYNYVARSHQPRGGCHMAMRYTQPIH